MVVKRLIRRSMNVALAVPVLIVLVGAAPVPSGTFALSQAPYTEGGSVTFSIGQLSHVNSNYEVTLAVSCTEPTGVEVQWTSVPNSYVYEFNSFGRQLSGQSRTLTLPVEGTGYSCDALLLSVDWHQGSPQQSWALDYHTFQVTTQTST
jgi:hypothetical protein